MQQIYTDPLSGDGLRVGFILNKKMCDIKCEMIYYISNESV
jgi:hypothetical protein